jgi:hypothetical protein
MPIKLTVRAEDIDDLRAQLLGILGYTAGDSDFQPYRASAQTAPRTTSPAPEHDPEPETETQPGPETETQPEPEEQTPPKKRRGRRTKAEIAAAKAEEEKVAAMKDKIRQAEAGMGKKQEPAEDKSETADESESPALSGRAAKLKAIDLLVKLYSGNAASKRKVTDLQAKWGVKKFTDVPDEKGGELLAEVEALS